MPETSALALLPPTPPVTTASTSYAPTSDSSFQQSLASAQQRTTTNTTDSAPTAPTNPPDKSDKKTAKRAKPKLVVATNKSKDQADETEASEPEEKSPQPVQVNAEAEVESPSEPAKAPAKEKPGTVTVEKNATNTVPIASSAAAKTPTPQATVPLAKKAPADRKPAVVKPLNSDPVKEKTDEAEPAQSKEVVSAQAAVPPPASSAGKPTVVKGGDFCTATANSATTTDSADAAVKVKVVPTQTGPTPNDAGELSQVASDILRAESDPATPHGLTQTEGPTIAPNFEQQLQHALAPLAPKAEAPAPPAPETQFVDANHPTIVTNVHSQLLPNGGTMQIRLDPPNLGALQVTVSMRDGVMTAAFETSNEQATRMLSHSLSQLKTALESGGVSVEKMHVQQSPKHESNSGSKGDQQNQSHDPEQQQQARQEQQRRQMLQRMWNKLAGVEEPLDLVA